MGSLPSQDVAYLQRTGGPEEVPDALRVLARWAADQGVEVTGGPIAIFYSEPSRTPANMLFWEVRLPIGSRPTSRRGDEVRTLRTEAVGRAACVKRVARPGGGGPDVDALRRWIRNEGLLVNGPRIEIYSASPTGNGIETRLCFPVVEG